MPTRLTLVPKLKDDVVRPLTDVEQSKVTARQLDRLASKFSKPRSTRRKRPEKLARVYEFVKLDDDDTDDAA